MRFWSSPAPSSFLWNIAPFTGADLAFAASSESLSAFDEDMATVVEGDW